MQTSYLENEGNLMVNNSNIIYFNYQHC